MRISSEHELIYTQIFRDKEEADRTVTTRPKISYLISNFNQSRDKGAYAEKEGYRSETLIRHFLVIPGNTNLNGEYNPVQHIELPIPTVNLKTLLEEKGISLEDTVDKA